MSLDFAMRPEWEQLRARARAVAERGVAEYGRWHDSWINGHSKDFSKVLAAEGWIGMTWPVAYGGGGRPGIERIIMAEEMISAGAPIAASWFADRQMGPSIYLYGTDSQKAELLPGMLSGEATWCIGMSEPDAGSDLASLKTTAVRDGGHYVVNGQKIWTSGAASAEFCYVICRTRTEGPPHRGLSELIVPMDLDGIEVRPVRDMVGTSHFCEIFLTDVRVPASNLVGTEGGAFKQTMVQLGYERGGIDRLVSNRPLYDLALEHRRPLRLADAPGDRGHRDRLPARAAHGVPGRAGPGWRRLQRGHQGLLHRARAAGGPVRGTGAGPGRHRRGGGAELDLLRARLHHPGRHVRHPAEHPRRASPPAAPRTALDGAGACASGTAAGIAICTVHWAAPPPGAIMGGYAEALPRGRKG